MTLQRPHLGDLRVTTIFAWIAAFFALFTSPELAPAQVLANTGSSVPVSRESASDFSSNSFDSAVHGLSSAGSPDSADPLASLPESPEPDGLGGGREKYNTPPAAVEYQKPFSRIGIGADVNPLGIGIKTAIVLNHLYDARFDVNFFNYNSGRFELEGFNVNANLHLLSSAASLDWYPFGSIWRISPGVMFFNANQLSVATSIVPGTSFTLNNQTFYSASANSATGATPLAGSGVLGLHTQVPAFTIAGGFGKFIPRSNRHWSFPSEFGVAFTGAPTANVIASGWVCTDAAQTKCSNVGDPANPVAIEFNSALQSSLTKWRQDLGKVTVYPLFSYSVVYSFNIR
ncbi:MAG: hypothetical protein ABSD67_15505 [Terracidiphilus sp.]|jgi:hypothetical protein